MDKCRRNIRFVLTLKSIWQNKFSEVKILYTVHPWTIQGFGGQTFITLKLCRPSTSAGPTNLRLCILSNCGSGENAWESLLLQGDQTSQSQRKSAMNIHWKGWCWSQSSKTLATWCEELTHLKRPWCWERLKVRRKGRDGWMASPTQWTRVWISSRSWWWTGKPGVLQSMGSQRGGHDWVA